MRRFKMKAVRIAPYALFRSKSVSATYRIYKFSIVPSFVPKSLFTHNYTSKTNAKKMDLLGTIECNAEFQIH
jgi:hypothetical protein